MIFQHNRPFDTETVRRLTTALAALWFGQGALAEVPIKSDRNLGTQLLAQSSKANLNEPSKLPLATSEGLAVFGDAAYQKGFSNFKTANPDAPKGGAITLGLSGSFDSLNPFAIKGTAPALMGYLGSGLVFQALGDSNLEEPFAVYPALAKKVTVATDRLSMEVQLRSDAKFHDGGAGYR